ncbi:phage-related minor tail protein [Brevibacillus sp. AG162]|uniref:hypothetical protein n=1 Tax=Brevibacillus sp. AG162 TaxID=2572910 RepID=UPI001153043C|nr:hypothetical protein [Brevibacillus sp. AG162]TQK41971.1 phage-related minor tail protein [Brevibacillus sp. AG162]
MSTLRELIVSIEFNDIDLKTLTKTDSLIDEIEDSLSSMANEILDATRDFTMMGKMGKKSLRDIQRESIVASTTLGLMSNEIQGATFRAIALGLALTGALAALIAIAGPTTAAVGALTASLVGAGIGAVAFGAVAVGALAQVFEAAEEVEKLEEKVANAKTAKERSEALADLSKLYKSMSSEQRDALTSLRDFKEFWVEFVGEFEKPVFRSFSVGLNSVKKLLTKLSPTISNVAETIVDLTESFNAKLDGYEFFKIFKWLETNAADSLRKFAYASGNFFMGFMSLLRAFDPIADDVEQGLVGMSKGFKKWADGLKDSEDFRRFLDYARENGPVVIAVISDIAQIGKKLVEELAPVGTVVLKGFKETTGFILDNWGPLGEVVIGVTAAGIAFVAMAKTWAIISGLITFIQTWRTVSLAAAVAQWGLNAAMLANPVGLVIAGIAALIGIGVLLYRNWDTVKAKAIELWNIIDSNPLLSLAMGPMKLLIDAGIALYENWDDIKRFGSDLWVNLSNTFATGVNKVIRILNPLIEKWNELTGSDVSKFEEMAIDYSIQVRDMEEKRKARNMGIDGSHATGLAEVAKNGYIAELHKGESVLTARQSDTLRSAGILAQNGNKPAINLGSNIPAGKATSTAPVLPNINITINAGGGGQSVDENKLAQMVEQRVAALFARLQAQQG